MELNINDDDVIRDPSSDVVEKAILGLSSDEFAILVQSDNDEKYLQVYCHGENAHGEEEFQLEYRDGSVDSHFGVIPNAISRSDIQHAFCRYLLGESDWQEKWQWEKVDLSGQFDYPETLLIRHDDYLAKYVGRTKEGKQFFLTTPFVSAAEGEPGCEFVSLFLFDDDGLFVDAETRKLGPRKDLDEKKATQIFQDILDSIGPVEFGDIKVETFQFDFEGVTFGLIPREIEDDDEPYIELHPGNYMAFTHPWNGEYDT